MDKELENRLEKLRDVIRISVPRREGQGPPEMAIYTGNLFNDDRTQSPIYRNAGEIQDHPIEWLWPGRIPVDMFTLLVGKQGCGKTFLALDIAAHLSMGAAWPASDDMSPVGRTVMLAAEDVADKVLVPRLRTLNADLSKITFLDAVRVQDNAGAVHIEQFNAVSRIVALDVLIGGLNAMRTLPPVRLVILDPITAYMGDTDQNSNVEVRAALNGLVLLAAKRHISVLGLNHLNRRNDTKDDTERILGSTAFAALARSVLMVRGTKLRNRLEHIKCNIGPLVDGLPFCVEDGKLVWEKSQTAPEHVRVWKWLKKQMPIKSGPLQKRAKIAGITWGQLQATARNHGVVRRSTGNNRNDGTIWEAPEAAEKP